MLRLRSDVSISSMGEDLSALLSIVFAIIKAMNDYRSVDSYQLTKNLEKSIEEFIVKFLEKDTNV